MADIPSHIGPYEITREIGRGGMGVVFLARDTRLDRDVAIKALPEEFAEDADRMARFEREAMALAQLNHANVAGIHGVEEQDGQRYLILEYVDGETLAERLDRGALPIDEAMEVAREIAAGVEAAHEAGIIHRDLKPDNIKITSDGKVKVLDFGLARSAELESNSSVANAATITSPTRRSPPPSPTIPGAILGTAPYMSPEQARGRKLDSRTDIWSYGVMLFEMFTGVSPFMGETVSDSIGAVLHKDPDLEVLPQRTPASVQRLIARCMVRDKVRRLQAIGDARVELEDALQLLQSGVLEETDLGHRSAQSRWVWPTISAVLLVAFALAMLINRSDTMSGTRPVPPEVTRVQQLTHKTGVEQDPSLSPDGRTLAFSSRDGDDLDIFVLRVGGENAVNLTADSDAEDFDPAFSPDGQQIAFVSTREGGGIYIMGATGENPRQISESGYDPVWSPDGQELAYSTDNAEDPYSRATVSNLWSVDVRTRERRRIQMGSSAGSTPADYDAVDPAWSPDGRWIAYWGNRGGQRDIYLSPADDGQRIALTNDAATDWKPMWAADGSRIFFLSDRNGRPNLWSISIDPQSGAATDDPQLVAAGTSTMLDAAISADGSRMVFAVSAENTTIESIGFDPDLERTIGQSHMVYSSTTGILKGVDVSLDGAWIVLCTLAPEEDIVVMRTDGTGRRRLMRDAYKDRGPRWSADASSLFFYSNRVGLYKIWQINRDGTNLRLVVEDPEASLNLSDWSPDGQTMIANLIKEDRQDMVFWDRTDDEGLTRREHVVSNFFGLSWSPDGSLIRGYSFDPRGTTSSSVYDVDEDQFRTIRLHEQSQLRALDEFDWLDSQRLMGWDQTRKQAAVFDVATGETRWLQDDFFGPGLYLFAKGGTELILLRATIESDIWLMEFGTDADAR